MNNLHRELAPISDAAWSQIEEERRAPSNAISPAGASWTCRVRPALRSPLSAPAICVMSRRRETEFRRDNARSRRWSNYAFLSSSIANDR